MISQGVSEIQIIRHMIQGKLCRMGMLAHCTEKERKDKQEIVDVFVQQARKQGVLTASDFYEYLHSLRSKIRTKRSRTQKDIDRLEVMQVIFDVLIEARKVAPFAPEKG